MFDFPPPGKPHINTEKVSSGCRIFYDVFQMTTPKIVSQWTELIQIEHIEV